MANTTTLRSADGYLKLKELRTTDVVSPLRDYLYIPLGGSRRGSIRTYANLMLTMLLGGLWHGASWNFVFWGGLHGLCLAVERRFSQGKARVFSWQSVSAWLRAALVFLLVSITWVFFRSPSVDVTALTFQKLLFAANGGIQWLYLPALIAVPAVLIGGFVARSFGYHWPILSIQKSYTPAAILFEGLIIYFFAASNISPFIYFQF